MVGIISLDALLVTMVLSTSYYSYSKNTNTNTTRKENPENVKGFGEPEVFLPFQCKTLNNNSHGLNIHLASYRD